MRFVRNLKKMAYLQFIKLIKLNKMKNKILQSIYNLFYYLDNRLDYIKSYDYETAPYCGHHYNGHKGKFTASGYHEGDGECYCKFLFWIIAKHTEENTWYMQTRKQFNKYYKRF